MSEDNIMPYAASKFVVMHSLVFPSIKLHLALCRMSVVKKYGEDWC